MPSVLAICSFIVGVKLFMEPALQPSAALSRGAFNRVRSRTRQLTFSPRSIAWSTTSLPVRPDAPNTAMVLTTSVDRRARWARASGCVTQGPWTNVVAVRAVARGKESASAMSTEDASRAAFRAQAHLAEESARSFPNDAEDICTTTQSSRRSCGDFARGTTQYIT